MHSLISTHSGISQFDIVAPCLEDFGAEHQQIGPLIRLNDLVPRYVSEAGFCDCRRHSTTSALERNPCSVEAPPARQSMRLGAFAGNAPPDLDGNTNGDSPNSARPCSTGRRTRGPPSFSTAGSSTSPRPCRFRPSVRRIARSGGGLRCPDQRETAEHVRRVHQLGYDVGIQEKHGHCSARDLCVRTRQVRFHLRRLLICAPGWCQGRTLTAPDMWYQGLKGQLWGHL